jgi:hypothetical protein
MIKYIAYAPTGTRALVEQRTAPAPPAADATAAAEQGSILQNSISGEKLSEKFPSSDFEHIFQNNYANLFGYCKE